jgi:hypothetical protein
MHIKVIKGKKYYYESIRVGKKVMSKYIGPVGKVKASEEPERIEETKDENFYLG